MSTNNIERFDSSVLTVCHFCAKPAETGITGAPECDNWRYVKCSNDYCPLRHVLFTVDSWNGQWKGCVSLLDHQRIVKELEARVQRLCAFNETEVCPVCKDEVPSDSMLSYNNAPNAFCQGCVDAGRV